MASGFPEPSCDYLASFRFTGALTRCPKAPSRSPASRSLRVTAPRIEAQLVETLLLNQVNFQTAIATKAARLVLAAGAGTPGRGGDSSTSRRDATTVSTRP